MLYEVITQAFGHRAIRGGQGHDDFHEKIIIDLNLIDKANLVDIDRYFRIIDILQDIDDPFFQFFFLYSEI